MPGVPQPEAAMPDADPLVARCACGTVEITARGAPILSVACYCDDCQEAARRIEAEGGTSHLRPDGGTEHLMFRRDRIAVTAGEERLRDLRLGPDSKTRRRVTDCCGTAMLLDFAPGHWLDAYRANFGPGAPAIAMRTMTKFAPGPLPDDGIPSLRGHDVRFFAKLLAAWIPMLLRRP
jgi:hypothetical protein